MKPGVVVSGAEVRSRHVGGRDGGGEGYWPAGRSRLVAALFVCVIEVPWETCES